MLPRLFLRGDAPAAAEPDGGLVRQGGRVPQGKDGEIHRQPPPFWISRYTAKNPEPDGSGFRLSMSDRSGDLAGTHTPGTNIHMAGRAVDDRLHTLHIGLPGTIGTPVRVGDLDAERNALVAELALCHPLHLLAVAYYCAFRRHNWYHTRKLLKMQVKFSKKHRLFSKSEELASIRNEELEYFCVRRSRAASYGSACSGAPRFSAPHSKRIPTRSRARLCPLRLMLREGRGESGGKVLRKGAESYIIQATILFACPQARETCFTLPGGPPGLGESGSRSGRRKKRGRLHERTRPEDL